MDESETPEQEAFDIVRMGLHLLVGEHLEEIDGLSEKLYDFVQTVTPVRAFSVQAALAAVLAHFGQQVGLDRQQALLLLDYMWELREGVEPDDDEAEEEEPVEVN